MRWTYNDGGRAAAGYNGTTGDCVVRAIAIATQLDYQTVYDALFALQKTAKGRSRVAIKARGNASPRHGVFKPYIKNYLESLGWKWACPQASANLERLLAGRSL